MKNDKKKTMIDKIIEIEKEKTTIVELYRIIGAHQGLNKTILDDLNTRITLSENNIKRLKKALIKKIENI